MKWFKHDTDSSTDAKIKKLLIRHGAVGYAIYFHCLELIWADVCETNITFELEHDSEIIADNLKIRGTANHSGVEIVEEIMKYMISLGLFETYNDRIFCLKALGRLDSSMTSSAKMRKAITEKKASHDFIMIQSCKNRTEEKRIEQNRTDKKASHDENQEIKEEHEENNNGRIYHNQETLKKIFAKTKEMKSIPTERRLTINIPNLSQVMDAMTNYTEEEIISALDNYEYIFQHRDEYRYFAYKDVCNFITNGGLASFVDDSNPMERFRIGGIMDHANGNAVTEFEEVEF